MTCKNCGTQIADKALICYRCGTPTFEAQADKALELMRRKERVVTVDASASVEAVQQAIRSALGLPDYTG